MSPYNDPEKQREYYEKNKEVLNRKNRQYYQDNKGRLVEYAREYRKTDKYKERITEYKRQYAIDNKDRINEKVRVWYSNNKEKAYAYRRAWALANPERHKQYRLNSHKKLRREVFEAYGGPVCACCAEDGEVFLTIDHINGKGNEHRRSIGNNGGKDFYSWLRKNNYPEGYQVLCFNCNQARGYRGYCHTIPENEIAPSRP